MQEIFNKKWANKPQEEPNEFAVELVKNSGIYQNLQILEIGAGNGRDTKFFVENGIKVDAVEISDSGVEQLEKIKYNILILKQDIREMKLQREKYDYIYSFSVLHYFKKEERENILKNIYTSLKDNGELFIACRSEADLMAEKSIAGNFNGVKRTFFTSEQLKKEISNAGFEIKKIEQKNIQYHKLVEEPVSNFIQVVAQKKMNKNYGLGL